MGEIEEHTRGRKDAAQTLIRYGDGAAVQLRPPAAMLPAAVPPAGATDAEARR
jgi:hypothetical protein